MLLIVNVVPLTVLAVLLIQWLRGDVVFSDEEIPAGTGETLAWVGGLLVALILVASLSLPTAHEGVKGISARLRRCGRIMAGDEDGSKVLVVLLWPLWFVLWNLCAAVRFVLILLSLVLIGLLLLFTARLHWTDLLQSQLDAVLEWGGSLYG